MRGRKHSYSPKLELDHRGSISALLLLSRSEGVDQRMGSQKLAHNLTYYASPDAMDYSDLWEVGEPSIIQEGVQLNLDFVRSFTP